MKRGLPGRLIEVVYNAVDHSSYSPDFDLKSEDPLVGYVGRIKKYKRIDILLHAMKTVLYRFPKARLEIAGSGDYLDSLIDLAKRLGIEDRVDFRGFVSEQEKVDILRRSHVVANPSSKEGWGVTVIEANACGTPVVASDVPGLRDAVVDRETGFLVTYADPAGLAVKICEVLGDGVLRERLSKRAVEWARRFNWNDSADAILGVVGDLVRRGD
jgi:glycosyltransferase involved in cell wall biosynthesis